MSDGKIDSDEAERMRQAEKAEFMKSTEPKARPDMAKITKEFARKFRAVCFGANWTGKVSFVGRAPSKPEDLGLYIHVEDIEKFLAARDELNKALDASQTVGPGLGPIPDLSKGPIV